MQNSWTTSKVNRKAGKLQQAMFMPSPHNNQGTSILRQLLIHTGPGNSQK
jgi:hypothetical protein